MNTQHTVERGRLMQALGDVWASESMDVGKWRLVYAPDGIQPMYGGWVVPVSAGVHGGNAYELVRAISHLQELAEVRSSLSISLMLDPFSNGNGISNHGK